MARSFEGVNGFEVVAHLVAKTKLVQEVINDAIEKAKTDFQDPIIILTGDFNRRKIDTVTEEYPDIVERDVPPTRGGRRLDVVYTNFPDEIKNSSCARPLQNGGGSESDHRVVLVEAAFPKLHIYENIEFEHQPFSATGEKTFLEKLRQTSWKPVMDQDSPSEAVNELNNILDGLMSASFPKKIVKYRSCDPPWITKYIRRLVRRRKRIFKREGRSASWKKMKEVTDNEIRASKQIFFTKVKSAAETPGNKMSNYFKNKCTPPFLLWEASCRKKLSFNKL